MFEHVELFLNQHVVDDVLDEPRRDDAEYRGEHHAGYRVGEALLVWQAVFEQAHVGLPFFFLRKVEHHAASPVMREHQKS